MREIIIVCLVLGPWILIGIAHGQGFTDLFGQQGKQVKILKDQIAELVVFKATLEKGYDIVRDGTTEIYLIKEGDFDMHQHHFDSLKKVKTIIKNDPRVEESRELLGNSRGVAAQILLLSRNGRSKDKYLPLIGPEYAAKVAKECDRDQQELDKLLAGDVFSMTDNERLERLDEIHQRAAKRYQFAVNMNESILDLQEKEGL